MVEIEDLDKLSNLKPFVKWLVESDKLDAIKLKIHPHYYNEVSHKS